MPLSDDYATAPPRLLRAGPLSLVFDSGDLRYVKWSGREVIRRIYAAVRDHNWDTVPGVISDLELRTAESAFHISYLSTHRQGDVHFVWRAAIRGADDGSIRFTFDGEAKSTFRRNRIGFCVLHPIRECAGIVCRARYANGSEQHLCFPDTIAAEQPVKWLHDLAGLSHEVAPGVWAELEFTGDLFEMEDQRNWIDASFKTFCTPLRLPFPMEIQAGTRLRQEVRLKIVGRRLEMENGTPAAITNPSAPIVIGRGDVSRKLPAIGLGSPYHALALHEEQLYRLVVLKPAHLRTDLRFWERDWPQRLHLADGEAADLNCPLEVALHLDESPGAGAKYAGEVLGRYRERLARAIVFHRGHMFTTPEALAATRKFLGKALAGVAIGGGTNADLYQLNLKRPPADADFISWSMNPQVHAFDNTSIAETPEAAAHQVASMRKYFPGKPLVVSPITLKPRFNPNATGPNPVFPPGELPPQVDPRQLSLFAAAWTLAMIKALAESGTDSATFYETTGWRGVMETEAGSTLPPKFSSIPGAVFPLYHVLADVAEFAGGEVVRTESSDPLSVASLLVRAGQRRRLLLANLSTEPRLVSLQNFDGIVLALQRRFEGFPFFEFFEAAFTMGSVGLIVAPCVIFHQNHQVGRFAFGLRKAAFH